MDKVFFIAALPQIALLDGEDNRDDVPKTFTQEEVNTMMASDRRKHEGNVSKHKDQATTALKELENLKGKTNLSAEEKTELESRIETLSNEMLTKEELSAKETKKRADKHGKEVSELTGDRDNWKNQFTNLTIRNEILGAAVNNDAFNPTQLVDLLNQKATMIEELDESGKPKGTFGTKIKFDDHDKDGNAITLDLSPKDAIKRMKDIEGYQNLFKGTGTGGLGGNNKGNSKDIDMVKLAKDPVAYRKYRETHGL